MTDNSKIVVEFGQNKLSEVCNVQFIAQIHPLSWSCHSNLHLISAMKTSTNHYLDALTDFGIDIRLNIMLSKICDQVLYVLKKAARSYRLA